MKEIAKTGEKILSYEKWVNQETGEVQTFAVVSRDKTGDHGFHKVWLQDLAKILGLLGGSKVAVFNHILSNINAISNEFGGTNREIAEATDVNKETVNQTIKILIEAGFLKKVRTGTYMVNSKMMVQGGHDKRVGLMLKYDGLQE